MDQAFVIDVGRQALTVTMMVALPLLVVSLVTGLLISLFQVATSLQDVTLTFVPKIIAVGATMLLAGHWMLGILMDYARDILTGLSGAIG